MRERRTVFGEVAELYEHARPSYPSRLVDDVLAVADPRLPALEIGCGTGKATRLFAGRGLDVLALEPSEPMAAVARRTLARFSNVQVEVSTFETFAGRSGGFGLVYAAQSWHWVDRSVGYRAAHRLLGADGTLALFWNRSQFHPDVQDALDRVYRREAPDLQTNGGGAGIERAGLDAEQIAEIGASGLFADVRALHYRWEQTYDSAGYLDLLRTHSDHRLLADEHRDRLLSAVATVLDARGGTITLAYVTRLYLARSGG